MDRSLRFAIIASLVVAGSAHAQSTPAAPPPATPPATPPAASAPPASTPGTTAAPTPPAGAPATTPAAAATPTSVPVNTFTPTFNPDLYLPPVRSPEDHGFSPGDTPTASIEELDEIYVPRDATIDLPALDGPLDGLVRGLNDLYAKTGLRLGFAYTTLFQQAGGGPGDRNGFAGDLDLMASWTLIGRGTKDTGTFVFTGEDRFRQSTQPPSALGGVLGTLTNTTGGFNDRGWVVRDGFWLQRLLDDHLRLLVGRADPSDYVGGHRMQSINNSFLNRAFSANASVAFPSGHVPTASVSILPTDFCYVTFGAANGYGTSNTINVSTLDNGDFFWFAEAGITPRFEGVGQGRYRVMLWRMDARPEISLPEDQGISVILEQDFGDRVLAFARYSYSDAELTNIQNAVQGGIGIRGLLGSPDNLAGFAGGYGQPPTGGGRDETVFEIFQRWQLTTHTQFTLGAQLIVNPSNSTNDADAVGVFSARLRVSF